MGRGKGSGKERRDWLTAGLRQEPPARDRRSAEHQAACSTGCGLRYFVPALGLVHHRGLAGKTRPPRQLSSPGRLPRARLGRLCKVLGSVILSCWSPPPLCKKGEAPGRTRPSPKPAKDEGRRPIVVPRPSRDATRGAASQRFLCILYHHYASQTLDRGCHAAIFPGQPGESGRSSTCVGMDSVRCWMSLTSVGSTINTRREEPTAWLHGPPRVRQRCGIHCIARHLQSFHSLASRFLGCPPLSGAGGVAEVALVQARPGGGSLLAGAPGLVVGDGGIEWTRRSAGKFRPGGGRQGSTAARARRAGPSGNSFPRGQPLRAPDGEEAPDAPGGGPQGKFNSETRYHSTRPRSKRRTSEGLVGVSLLRGCVSRYGGVWRLTFRTRRDALRSCSRLPICRLSCSAAPGSCLRHNRLVKVVSTRQAGSPAARQQDSWSLADSVEHDAQ